MKHRHPFTYCFLKQFNERSILCGLTLLCHLTFVDSDHCAAWLRGVRRNHHKLPFKVKLLR